MIYQVFNPMDLTGKTVLVTGASSGIGQACAVFMSRLGAKIALCARREQQLRETLSNMEGEGHRIYPYDLSDTNGIKALVDNIVSDMGALSGILYAAGIAPMRPLSILKPENMESVMRINLYAFLELTRCAVKKGKMQNPASIVAISSIASKQGSKAKIAYSASKSALDASVRCIAKELAEIGIRVNTIAPAFVKTPMLEDYSELAGDSDTIKNRINEQILGLIEPDEVASMATYLMSDLSKTITGSQILIDSGRLA